MLGQLNLKNNNFYLYLFKNDFDKLKNGSIDGTYVREVNSVKFPIKLIIDKSLGLKELRLDFFDDLINLGLSEDVSFNLFNFGSYEGFAGDYHLFLKSEQNFTNVDYLSIEMLEGRLLF